MIELLDFGSRDSIFVSFGSRTPVPMTQFGTAFFLKYRLNAILVTSLGLHWYQYGDSNEAAEAIRSACEPFSKVIAYGTSMGGYAALAFSAIVQPDLVLAFSPQFSVDRAKVPFESRWKNDAKLIEEDGGFIWDEMKISRKAKVVIFYDPFDPDVFHVDLIRNVREDLVEFKVPFSSHRTLRVLREVGLLTPLLLSAQNGLLDFVELKRKVRARRMDSATYLRNLSRAVDARKRSGAKLLLSRAVENTLDQDAEGIESNFRLASRYGAPGLAIREYIRCLLSGDYLKTGPVVSDFKRLLPALLQSDRVPVIEGIFINIMMQDGEARKSVLVMMVHMRIAQGRHSDALATLNLLGVVGGYPEYSLEAARALQLCGYSEEAIRLAREGLGYRLNDLDLLYFVACGMEDAGQVDSALKLYLDADKRNALPLIPHRFRMANLHRRLGNFSESLSHCQAIVHTNPDYVNALRLMGQCQFQLGEFAAAAESFERALSLADDSSCFEGMAKSQMELSLLGQASSTINRALKIFPDRKSLLNILKEIELQTN